MSLGGGYRKHIDVGTIDARKNLDSNSTGCKIKGTYYQKDNHYGFRTICRKQ